MHPATDMSTVYYMMEKLLKIKSQLNVKSIICVRDQTIYAKAYQINCKEPTKFQDVFLMMGTFHFILTFMPVLVVRFKDARLKDIVVQCMIAAEGSIGSIFSGTRSYNWAVRIYKILYKTFLRIFQNEFEVENIEVINAVHQRPANIDDPFDSEQVLASPELQQ